MNSSAEPFFYDRSGRRYEISSPRWRGDDGTPLAVSPMPGIAPAQIVTSERSLWRYQAVIPVPARHRISLGEGATPMVPLGWDGRRVHFKLEWFNPTSSFKDRGVAVMMSHLAGQGVTKVLEDSSGNGWSAVAAYCAAAGLGAKILVPELTSAAAIRQSAQLTYASHNWHPFFLQGTKTVAYEMWEDLGFRAPDNVVLVAGAGSNVLGCDIAFGELLGAGRIERLPRLLIGQPEHWATIADTCNGLDPADRGPREPTIAEGAAIADPVRLPEAVAAIRRSGGAAVAVPDSAIGTAVRKLAARGLYAEPTSCVAVAALDHFLAEGVIAADETTVVVLTGSGLKSSEQMARVFDRSPAVE
ncbi:threonine synthase [Nocardia brasiliensis]|uniref:threonine synthase n=1 Tax=Nocardia brasiliensis TaxID=37326 RepID=UPI003D9291C5